MAGFALWASRSGTRKLASNGLRESTVGVRNAPVQARPAGSAQFHGTAYHGVNRHRLALESELPREDFGLTSPPSRQDTFRERRFTEVVCGPQIAPDVHPRTRLHPGEAQTQQRDVHLRRRRGRSNGPNPAFAAHRLRRPVPFSLIGRQSTVAQSIGWQFCNLGVARSNPSVAPSSPPLNGSAIPESTVAGAIVTPAATGSRPKQVPQPARARRRCFPWTYTG